MTAWGHEADIPRDWRDRLLAVGTRSVLFGAHQFLLHPLCLFLAWWRLYGFPADPRLWVVFFAHDLGYWGLRDLDGDAGQLHPAWGGALVGRWFGRAWGDLCLGHSRYYAQRVGIPVSKLMRADKYATCLMPLWLYVALVWLSGEYKEYIIIHGKSGAQFPPTLLGWARCMRADWLAAYGPGAGGA